MNKLLSAGFTRLKKDKVFWMSVLLMAGLGIYISISNYSFSQTYGQTVVLDSNIFSHILLVPIVFRILQFVYRDRIQRWNHSKQNCRRTYTQGDLSRKPHRLHSGKSNHIRCI